MMKIEISRRNFLLGASAVAAFGSELIKKVQATEEDMFQSFSRINRAYLLSVNNEILAAIDSGVMCMKTDDKLVLEMRNFLVEESGLADRIAVYDNDTMMFTVGLTAPCSVNIGNTAFVDCIYVGGPRLNKSV